MFGKWNEKIGTQTWRNIMSMYRQEISINFSEMMGSIDSKILLDADLVTERV